MIDSQPIQILGLVLIHFIWQGLLIGLLFGGVRLVLKGQTAVARYNWGVICLILLALAPLATLAWLTSTPGHPAASGLMVMSESYRAGAEVSAPSSTGLTLSLLLPWIVGLWLVGVMLMSVRLGAGWWYVCQLRRRADYCIPVDIRNQLDELAFKLKMTRDVGLAFSSQIAGPMLVGLIKPLILLPTGLVNGLSARQVEMVLAHELSHLHRADHLVNLFQNIVETLLFYHPVVRWISNDVRAERELVSDEQAARLTGDRVGYAETLLQLEKVRGDRLSLAIGMADHQLVTRVRYLLSPQSRQSGSVISGMTLLTVLLVGALTALVSTGLQSFSEREAPEAAAVSATEKPTEVAVEPERIERINEASDEHVATAEQAQSSRVSVEKPPASAEAPLPEQAQTIQPALIEPPEIVDPFQQIQIEPVVEAVPAPVENDQLAEVVVQPIGIDTVGSEPDVPQAGKELIMASLTAPAPTDEVLGGELLSSLVPEYPTVAARRRQEGKVEVSLTVSRDGRVTDVAVIAESPRGYGFGEAAIQAAEQWRFEPFTLNGQAIQHEIRTGFDFTDPPPCGRVTGTRISRC